MSRVNSQSKSSILFFLIISIMGIVLSILTLRTGLRQDDHFTILIGILWLIIFVISIKRNSIDYKRKALEFQEGDRQSI